MNLFQVFIFRMIRCAGVFTLVYGTISFVQVLLGMIKDMLSEKTTVNYNLFRAILTSFCIALGILLVSIGK